MKSRISLIAAVLAIGLVAGCGGSSSSTTTTSTQSFKPGFTAATAQLQQTAGSIANAVKGASGQTNSQIQSTFSNLASQWASASAKLNSIQPPAAASADFAALKSQSASVEADLHTIADSASSNNVAAAKAATVKLIRDILATKAAAQKVQSET